MTVVLHTHNRKLDFHPHLHVVVPGGGVDKRRRRWKKKKGQYLFNKEVMAKVFRARFLAALNEAGLYIFGFVFIIIIFRTPFSLALAVWRPVQKVVVAFLLNIQIVRSKTKQGY